jgi:hypothetical protein
LAGQTLLEEQVLKKKSLIYRVGTPSKQFLKGKPEFKIKVNLNKVQSISVLPSLTQIVLV